jgi:flavin-binding protein dodecin
VATAKVKPNARPYTGTSDGIARARQAGMDEWIKQAIAASDNTLNNLGSYMVRDQKGHMQVFSASTQQAEQLTLDLPTAKQR